MQNHQGAILSLQVCVGYRKPMMLVESAEVIKGLGLRGDRHAVEESTRQILLIEKETLDELKLSPGLVKENITTRGIRLMNLERGQRLRLGDAAVLEVTKACTPCGRMDEIRGGLQEQLAGRRGVLAKAIQGGVIKIGDSIKVL
jgi:MOSC domain-containing protein YiiM